MNRHALREHGPITVSVSSIAMQNFGSTSHRLSHLYSNVDDIDNSSADELNDDEDLDDHWLLVGRPPPPDELLPIRTLNRKLMRVIDPLQKYDVRCALSLFGGADFIEKDEDNHYVSVGVREAGKPNITTLIYADYCSLKDIGGWVELAWILSMECFIGFSFDHYSVSVNSPSWSSDLWADVNFQCINQVMRAVEKSHSIVSLDYQSYYHHMFHSINYRRFGMNKYTKSLRLTPHTYRYGYYHNYNDIISGFYSNRLGELDLTEGLAHPRDFCHFESLFPTFMQVRILRLLIPEGFSIPTLNIVFCSSQSTVEEFDVTFDEPVDRRMLVELGNCIGSSSTLKKLRITISTDLRRALCRMLKQTRLRECVVRFINNANFLRYCHMNPRHTSGVSYDEMQQGIYCLEFARLLGIGSGQRLIDVILSMHALCVKVEGSTNAFLEEACKLNRLYSDSLQNCAIKKCALSCVRRHDFDASSEMGIINANVVVEILGAISFLKENDNMEETGQDFGKRCWRRQGMVKRTTKTIG
jgi:hypothetical protein